MELFRANQAKIEKKHSGLLTIEHRDMELRRILANENKLHPALFSAEAEHKVVYLLTFFLALQIMLKSLICRAYLERLMYCFLIFCLFKCGYDAFCTFCFQVLQHLMDGLVSFTFKPEDLQCFLFRYMARELLASTVMRPVLNMASPRYVLLPDLLLCFIVFQLSLFFFNLFFGRFINEKIEFLVLKMTKGNKGLPVQGTSQSKPDESSRISSDHFSKFLDPSVTGVELVQLKNAQSRTAADTSATDHVNGNKDPLLSIDPRSTRSWNALPLNSQTSDERGLERHLSGGEWGDMLDLISRRKTQALAPEHFENMWTKGRDYRKKDGENRVIEQVPQGSAAAKSIKVDNLKATSKPKEKNTITKLNHSESGTVHSGCTDRLSVEKSFHPTGRSMSNRSSFVSYDEDDEHNMCLEEVDSGSSTSYTSEDEETSNVTGLDSPVTKVWDGRSNRNLSISHIHHPLENSEGRIAKKTGKGHLHYQRLARPPSSHKRSRTSSKKMHIWQEVERTSFFSGDGQDILSSAKGRANAEDSSDDSEIENLGRVQSGAAASSSAPSFSISESQRLTVSSLQNSLALDSFFKLRCEVLIIKLCDLPCFGMVNFCFLMY